MVRTTTICCTVPLPYGNTLPLDRLHLLIPGCTLLYVTLICWALRCCPVLRFTQPRLRSADHTRGPLLTGPFTLHLHGWIRLFPHSFTFVRCTLVTFVTLGSCPVYPARYGWTLIAFTFGLDLPRFGWTPVTFTGSRVYTVYVAPGSSRFGFDCLRYICPLDVPVVVVVAPLNHGAVTGGVVVG